jgi:hypothetical protein
MNARLKKLQNETFKLKNENSQSSIKERIASPTSNVLASMSDGFDNYPGYMNTQSSFNVSNYNNNNEMGSSMMNFNKPSS